VLYNLMYDEGLVNANNIHIFTCEPNCITFCILETNQ
jgi:hypothetical protein